MVEFTGEGIEVPYTELVGVVHYAGIRRYLWRDAWWTEYDLNYHRIQPKVYTEWYSLVKENWKHVGMPTEQAHSVRVNQQAALLRLVKLFRMLPAPQAGYSELFVRVLRRID